MWNFFLLYLSFYVSKAFRTPFILGKPLKIGFEPTTSCNLRCPMCPSGLRSFTRPTGMAQLELFQRVIDQSYQDLIYLLLYFQGEPYLNPHFFDMISYANDRGVYVATSTNGHYLSRENAIKTVQSGLSELIVSIDGATQKTYESYRVGGKLSKVKEGVKQLVQVREELNSPGPFIILQFLVVAPNEHEIDAIQELGRELGVDRVVFKTAQIYDFENGNELMPSNEKYSRYRKGEDGKYHIKNPLNNQCWKMWQGLEVSWDGKVLPCCFDKDAKYEMGTIEQEELGKIWQAPAYNSFRRQLLYSRKQIDICQNCSEGTKVWS
ncbi:MAG: SPASM domain-containing protein [Bacteroidia bacterium]|nr:SPASM domain-containing protein [Bacteroidia bacterium]